MTRTTADQIAAEEARAIEQLAAAKRWRLCAGRQVVLDQYAAPRRPAPEPLPDLSKAVALMAQGTPQEPPPSLSRPRDLSGKPDPEGS